MDNKIVYLIKTGNYYIEEQSNNYTTMHNFATLIDFATKYTSERIVKNKIECLKNSELEPHLASYKYEIVCISKEKLSQHKDSISYHENLLINLITE